MKCPALIFLGLMLIPSMGRATHDFTNITVTVPQALHLAADLIENNDTTQAKIILNNIPDTKTAGYEIERYFLMAKIARQNGEYKQAIYILKTILDAQPDLARVRFELAQCYMDTHQWYRAEYQLRLAMAGTDLSEQARETMMKYRFYIRQQKRWNMWFNFGAAPDNNVNNAVNGTECVNTAFGPLCRNLDEPESAIGYNLQFGGDYEFVMADDWRWKSAATAYTNIYDNHDYDDLYLAIKTGPRYIWTRGDVWIAGLIGRRFYGWDRYNVSAGVQIDTSLDITRKMTGNLRMGITNNDYDLYGDILNGQAYNTDLRIVYSFNAHTYMVGRSGISREVTQNDIYSNWSPYLSVGFGIEIPWGFHIYAEPRIMWEFYDAPKWTVHNGDFDKITERDFTQSYMLAISNNKLSALGFTPALNFVFTRRNSNMWQREYDKFTVGINLQRQF